MIVSLTHQQMLQTWRRCAGLEPLVSACTVERFDGIDIDSRLTDMMRQWYLRLLDSGDPAMLGDAADADGLVSVAVGPCDCFARLICDASVRRLQSVRLSGWERAAAVVDGRDISRTLALQSNPYSRAGNADPIAWRDSSGAIFAVPAAPGSAIVEAKAYIDTGAETYRLDERALATIPEPVSIF